MWHALILSLFLHDYFKSVLCQELIKLGSLPVRLSGACLYLWDIQTSIAAAFSTASIRAAGIGSSRWSTSIHRIYPSSVRRSRI